MPGNLNILVRGGRQGRRGERRGGGGREEKGHTGTIGSEVVGGTTRTAGTSVSFAANARAISAAVALLRTREFGGAILTHLYEKKKENKKKYEKTTLTK